MFLSEHVQSALSRLYRGRRGKRFKAPFKLNLTEDFAKILFFVEVLVYITSQLGIFCICLQFNIYFLFYYR